ncbi:MAG: heme/hemin ABC transporter substrate-binding protein [Sporichthyaceae bacterium]
MAGPMRVARFALAFALAGTLAACGGVQGTAADTSPVAVEGAVDTSAGKRACKGAATATANTAVTPIATGTQPVFPTTITDDRGKQVTIQKADRILALDLSGTLATTVYALGLGDRIVGRDISTGVPELQDRPLVTVNGHNLNAEAILDLQPDLLISNYSVGPLEVQLQLENSGVPVVILGNNSSLGAIGSEVKRVASVFGLAELGDQLAAKVDADLATARARVAELAPADPAQRIRMAFLYMRGTAGVYSWFGKGSGADELIAELKGVDVASEAGVPGNRPLNAEGLVSARPEMFLMMTHGLESVGGIDGLKKIAGIGDTDAGKASCVVDMIDYQILSFGPIYPAVLTALAEAIYTQAAPA